MSVARRSWVASGQTAVACRSPNARCPPSLRSTASPSSRVEQAGAAEAALHWLLAEEPSLHSIVRDRQHAAGQRSSQSLRSSTALPGRVNGAARSEMFSETNPNLDHKSARALRHDVSTKCSTDRRGFDVSAPLVALLRSISRRRRAPRPAVGPPTQAILKPFSRHARSRSHHGHRAATVTPLITPDDLTFLDLT